MVTLGRNVAKAADGDGHDVSLCHACDEREATMDLYGLAVGANAGSLGVDENVFAALEGMLCASKRFHVCGPAVYGDAAHACEEPAHDRVLVELGLHDGAHAPPAGDDLAGLASRCGAHVQDVGSRAGIQDERRHHGREALQVHPALPVDVQIPDGLLAHVLEHERVAVPREAAVCDVRRIERVGDLVWLRLERVRPERHRAGARLVETALHERRLVRSVALGNLLAHKGGNLKFGHIASPGGRGSVCSQYEQPH